MPLEWKVNQFAIRSFRDQGDEDYISARMACRAQLVSPFLWSSQQTIEKYLKCILLLNRIPAKSVMHDLCEAVELIKRSDKLVFELTPKSQQFIDHVDRYGPFRYLEISNIAYGKQLISLDGAAWELRRYCTLSDAPRKVTIQRGVTPPIVRLPGGYLEKIIDNLEHPAREPLLWQNAFFGKRGRKRIRYHSWFKATNAPLYLHPEILEEVWKYVYLPKPIRDGYKDHKGP